MYDTIILSITHSNGSKGAYDVYLCTPHPVLLSGHLDTPDWGPQIWPTQILTPQIWSPQIWSPQISGSGSLDGAAHHHP